MICWKNKDFRYPPVPAETAEKIKILLRRGLTKPKPVVQEINPGYYLSFGG